MSLPRRRALQLLAGGIGALAWPRSGAAAGVVEWYLRAAPALQALAADGTGSTEVWGYDGHAPGPVLRARQGERLSVAVTNGLPAPTTVHWHGIRLPVEMDGVPHAPTPPILPGASFTYAFDLPDAGTYWYHPHFDDSEQVGRGLAGALIVEEPVPPAVDRDLVWVLGDWRLDSDGRIDPAFDAIADMSQAGRIGNLVTINGRVPDSVTVRANERLRLRLINAASARIFELEFAGHRPIELALDGQPLAAPAPVERLVLAPGQRADLLIDCPHAPGERFPLLDHSDPPAPPGGPRPYRLATVTYGPPVRPAALADPIVLPANPLPVPDLANAVPCRIELAGGANGRLAAARLEGELIEMAHLMRRGRAWALNGVVGSSHYHFDAPLMQLRQGQTGRLTVVNQTLWRHPIHLHGFPVLQLNSGSQRGPFWRDTILLEPGGQADLAFVAERPGQWMFHCHILEHQAGGMMGFVNVEP